MTGLSYAASGVDYGPLDAFKRACQAAASGTVGLLAAHGVTEPSGTRGESAYLTELPDCFVAHVEEGLGTKNLVADAVLAATGGSHYHAIGIDLVGTIVNDLITPGALPVAVAMHLAVADASWFDGPRGADLAAGFAAGCRAAGAVWGGGETPALKGVVMPGAAVLGGSAWGLIRPKPLRITGEVAPGDAIMFLASSGIHANGVTLCRALADRLPAGYGTPIGDGRSYGEALLAPTVIYAAFIAGCQSVGLRLGYAVNMTGHGWRKLMRLDRPLRYRIDAPGDPGALFRFIMEAGPVSPVEAYATFNMGVGFAVMLPAADLAGALDVARAAGYTAWAAGAVEDGGGRRSVVIPSLQIEYESSSLAIR